MPWKALKTASGTGWKELDRAAGTGWKELLFDVAALDMGAACILRSGALSTGYTRLGATNPANGNGTLTKACIYVATNTSGIKIGSFYNTSSNNWKCRDVETIGSLAAGKHENIVISLDVQTNDRLGIWLDSGSIERGQEGDCVGSRYANGDVITVDTETNFADGGTWCASVYCST